jgi:hypothetical protein
MVMSDISYVGASFPKLSFRDEYESNLAVTADGETKHSSILCDMDSVVAQDFKNSWPGVVSRTMLSSGTKAGADATVQNVASNSFGFAGQLITKATSAVVQPKLNEADTRTWESLPKKFQYVCVPNPASGQLTIGAGANAQQIQIAQNEVNVVYVKSDTPGSPLLVNQFTFASVLP